MLNRNSSEVAIKDADVFHAVTNDTQHEVWGSPEHVSWDLNFTIAIFDGFQRDSSAHSPKNRNHAGIVCWPDWHDPTSAWQVAQDAITHQGGHMLLSGCSVEAEMLSDISPRRSPPFLLKKGLNEMRNLALALGRLVARGGWSAGTQRYHTFVWYYIS